MKVKFGSLCSGIDAASVAWNPLGWEASWFSEIEPFPSAVLNYHYPDIPNLGDMLHITEKILNEEVEAPDVLCGGTPCQAFSVAGLRKSLDDSRGNLSLTFCEVANAIDNVRSKRNESPCVIVWENVPGVLSTKDNAFGHFLAGLAGEDDALIPSGGKWSNAGCVFGPQRAVAWRILDAQYFGVAQRRRRVFVVASAREGFDPTAVLFEFDSMRRDTAPSREAGKAATSSTGVCVEIGSSGSRLTDLSPTLDTSIKDGPTHNQLTAAVLQPYNVENTVATRMTMPINTQIATRHKALGEGTGFGIGGENDPSFTLTKGHSHAVAVLPVGNPAPPQSSAFIATAEVAPTIGASGPPYSRTGNARVETEALAVGIDPGVMQAMQVRRLTPTECERLQGFPDGYTAIPWRKKPAEECPDGPRYKALGNSWAVPVVQWLGKRIDESLKTDDNTGLRRISKDN